jgi:hypothetical protein
MSATDGSDRKGAAARRPPFRGAEPLNSEEAEVGRSWRRLRHHGAVDDADEQQGQPAQLDVAADAVLAVVEHRPQPEGALEVAPPAEPMTSRFLKGGELRVLVSGGR